MSIDSPIVIETSKDSPWLLKNIDQVDSLPIVNLRVFEEKARSIDGFGTCLNELGKKAIDTLSKEKKEILLDDLFGKDLECSFTICRLPVGANDYAINWYSYDEVDGDYDLKHFSIERDKKYIIPYAKEALKRNPNITFFSSPWSPPTWMKTKKVYNFGKLRWEPKVLKSYALYFVKYIEEYRREGIHIDQIHVQNEVIADQKFPSCRWTGKELNEFIKDYLAPAFRENNIDTEIWLGTLNCPEFNNIDNWKDGYDEYAGRLLNDPETYHLISGVGYQWAGKNVIQKTVQSFPEKKYLQTESECGNGKNSWNYAQYIYNLMRHYLVNGVNGYVYWNAVLEPEGISTWGWKQNSMMTINSDGEVIKNPEYYVMKHFSHFVKKGAVRLTVDGHLSADSLAFKNPDGSIVLTINNGSEIDRPLNLVVNTKKYTMKLKGDSIYTLVFN